MGTFQLQEIIACLQDGVKHAEKFPPSVREFAIQLQYLSPRAYKYVRQRFSNHLPDTSTDQYLVHKYRLGHQCWYYTIIVGLTRTVITTQTRRWWSANSIANFR